MKKLIVKGSLISVNALEYNRTPFIEFCVEMLRHGTNGQKEIARNQVLKWDFDFISIDGVVYKGI